MPDPAAIAGLGVLLTVLVFLNGFISVRLHAFHERAMDRIRAIDEALTSEKQVPYFLLEARERELRQQPLPPLTGLALLSSSLILLAVVVLAFITSLDATTSTQYWAIGLTAGAAFVVFAVTVLDHTLLRRRVRSRLDNLPLAQLSAIEGGLFDAFVVTRRARERLDYRTTAAIFRVWVNVYGPEELESLDTLVLTELASRDREIAILQAKLRDGPDDLYMRYAAHLDGLLDALRDLLRRPGLTEWPRGLGCRGVARLCRGIYETDWKPHPSPLDRTQIEQDLTSAAGNEPREPRWPWALATFCEALENVDQAGTWAAIAARYDYGLEQALPTPAGGTPTGLVAALDSGLAYPKPSQPSTYVEALRRVMEVDGTAPSSAAHLLVMDVLRQATHPGKESYAEDLHWSADPYLEALRSVVQRDVASTELGWVSAKHLIGMSRTWLTTQTQTLAVTDLLNGVYTIESELVVPAEVKWYVDHTSTSSP
jgi:hypothetical protein